MIISFRSVRILNERTVQYGNSIQTTTTYDMSGVCLHTLDYPFWKVLVHWTHLIKVPFCGLIASLPLLVYFSIIAVQDKRSLPHCHLLACHRLPGINPLDHPWKNEGVGTKTTRLGWGREVHGGNGWSMG